MTLSRMRSGLMGALVTLAIWCSMAALKAVSAIVLTAVVVMVPGTRPGDVPAEIDAKSTAVLQQELQGWVHAQAVDGWVTDQYPRSMGAFTGSDDPLFAVSTAIGNANLNCLIDASVDLGVVGFGYSQGATVVNLWLNDHANGKDPSAPAANDVSFVLIGNPNRPNGGLLARVPGIYIPVIGVPFSGATPESQYKVTDVVRQYDLFADFPVDPLNVFAMLNIIADAGAIHGDYLNVDVNSPENWVETSGNTTYIMEPAKSLPLLQPLRNIAALMGRTQTPLIDAMEPVLKYFVELGYDRTNQGTPTTFQPGSSIQRFFQTLPQFADSVKQGVNTLRTELHPSTALPSSTTNTGSTVSDRPTSNSQPDNTFSTSTQLKPRRPRMTSVDRNVALVSNDNKRSAGSQWKPGDGLKHALNRSNAVAHRNTQVSGASASSPAKHSSSRRASRSGS